MPTPLNVQKRAATTTPEVTPSASPEQGTKTKQLAGGGGYDEQMKRLEPAKDGGPPEKTRPSDASSGLRARAARITESVRAFQATRDKSMIPALRADLDAFFALYDAAPEDERRAQETIARTLSKLRDNLPSQETSTRSEAKTAKPEKVAESCKDDAAKGREPQGGAVAGLRPLADRIVAGVKTPATRADPKQRAALLADIEAFSAAVDAIAPEAWPSLDAQMRYSQMAAKFNGMKAMLGGDERDDEDKERLAE
ncbi:MAG: hypothetical protein U1F43_21335 [Myxococcota bacterium]